MGGNALKNYGCERVDLITYERIKLYVINKLSPFFDKIKIPLSLSDKKDYGDIDIIAIPKIQNIVEKIQEIFSPRKIIKNGSIYSFNVENLQIDLICETEENYEIHSQFLNFGDMSMILGRVARLYKLKYGIDGLSLPIRDPIDDHVIEVIPISKNLRKILTFFGYDAEMYFKGFQTKEELRDFVFSSKKINQGFLTKDSENCTHRKRDRKREAYKEIYAWFQNNREKFPLKPEEKPFLDLLNEVDLFFLESQIKKKYFAILKEIDKIKKAREKFSGDCVAKFLNISGKELGLVMESFSRKFSSREEKIDYILNSDILALNKEIEKIYEQISR